MEESSKKLSTIKHDNYTELNARVERLEIALVALITQFESDLPDMFVRQLRLILRLGGKHG